MKIPVTSTTKTVVAALLALGVASSGSLLRSQVSHRPWQTPDTDVEKKQRESMRSGGLAAAAAVTGSFVISSPARSAAGPANLDELASLSPIIVIGWADSNKCRLTVDGRSIETLYDVRIESMIKGNLAAGNSITVTVPGGKVGFADGAWAQVDTPGFLPPQPAHRFVWFLRESKENSGTFELSQGPLSLFDLRPPVGAYVQTSGNQKSMLARYVMRARLTPEQLIAALKPVRY
jgi:hypothetical protein